MPSKVTRLPRPTPAHLALDRAALAAVVTGRISGRFALTPAHAALVTALAGLGPDAANAGRRGR